MTTTPAKPEPIRIDWKITDVIRRYPQLVDELIALSPTFRLLRHPVARRVQARLVTVEQAARIVGLDPKNLVAHLNATVGVVTDTSEIIAKTEEPQDQTAPDWVTAAPVVADVDVRDLQRSGEEPFGRIMAATRQTAIGQVLRVRCSFEPFPLYTVMAQRGFDHWTERHADEDWQVWFRSVGRPPEATSSAQTASPDADNAGWTCPTSTLTIDVSELVPPEPLIRIMDALEALPQGRSLLVHHVRRPMYLYPQLEQSGYRHQTRDLGAGRVEILIQKPGREQ